MSVNEARFRSLSYMSKLTTALGALKKGKAISSTMRQSLIQQGYLDGDKMTDKGRDLLGRWDQLFASKSAVEDFRGLAGVEKYSDRRLDE